MTEDAANRQIADRSGVPVVSGMEDLVLLLFYMTD